MKRFLKTTVMAVFSFALVFGSIPAMSAAAQTTSDDGAPIAKTDKVSTLATKKGVQKLKSNTTYTTTLQGAQSHKVSWDYLSNKSDNGYTIKTFLYVDGKKKTVTANGVDVDVDGSLGDQIKVSLATVNKNTKLIVLELKDFNESWVRFARVYKYDKTSQSLTLLGDAIKQSPTGKSSSVSENAGLFKATKNKLYFRWANPSTHSIGFIEFYAVFKYSKDKLKGSSYAKLSIPSAKKSLTAKKNFKVYTKPGGKKVKFSVNKGNKVNVIQIKKYKKNRPYIQIKKGGKKGWIRATKKSTEGSLLFKEVDFAA